MTLEQLRIFVAVAERLHMTRGAEALHITQSAASAGVAAVEARYGVKLFDRVGRGLALSEAGRLFLPEARAVLMSAHAAEQALDDLAGLKRGLVTLAASQTVASYWLPARMARFAVMYPGVELTLRIGNTAQVEQAVLEGAVELGFVEGAGACPAALARRRVAEDRLALYAAPDHPLAGIEVTPDDLQATVWVLREPGSGTRSEMEQALVRRGVDPTTRQLLLELPSNEAVLAAVASGDAIAAASELAARALVDAGRVVELRFDLGRRGFDLVTKTERRRSRAGAALLDLL